MTWTSPNAPTMMFAGFRSRWITPRAWAYPTAWATAANTARTSTGAFAFSKSSRVSPLISFMARKGRPSASVPDLVDGRDAGVLELAGDAGLVKKASGGGGPVGVLVREELDGHLAVQSPVAGPPYNAHAAAADLVEQVEPWWVGGNVNRGCVWSG